ncbi:enoyl-CoA hydratase-related protein [Mangrovihabitans endophyticus]|uniref:Enoyl-CoA hydratase n=1 Tax=Mangrovihabitans endophyticus TaxID=1751298 RepID=A0A8J3C713_9ACTN|nr:enoyl-CoA hydratase-related protein [Mangrovihabitans endophyticus]GGL14895.1 enoyl-CoA hydratase [Mangrovihabitans endophyticus]
MELVRTATAAGIATLTLDSPSNRNALSTALIEQLLGGLADATADPAVRAVVLSHAGPVFCSGADLKETRATVGQDPDGPTPAPARLPVEMTADLLAAVWESPKPVVARVAGPARAGGLGLIAAADIAVCDRAATFAFTEVRLGVIPAVISATVLPRLAPRAAAELYLTGDTFDGARAAEIGLVTKAVDAAGLDDAVRAYCTALVRGGPLALAGTKRLLRRAAPGPIRTELSELAAQSAGYFRSAEAREGMAAAREKRPADWIPPSPDE